MIDVTRFREHLIGFDALRENDEIEMETVERIAPRYADQWPTNLHSSVRNALENAGVKRLYRHQAEAIDLSLSGADVVLESPTASGKTVAFTTPMLDSLIRSRGSHALMIYPMKALAFDQRTQIEQLCRPLRIESYPYDGDTEMEHRNLLRDSPPQILLTNPEYLNRSFLGWREKWHNFLRKLRYVVIDEIHEYHGYFGGNMAMLLRRFFLHLERIGANPRVFLSSATCANAVEHAKNLTGRDVEVVSARDGLRPKRHYIFVNPSIPARNYRDILRLRVEKAALAILAEGLRVLVFCPTKRFLEYAFGNCKHLAEENGFDPERIAPFHGDLMSEERQRIQQGIRAGEIDVVFTTNALELGLDIGGLDGVILAGFPPRITSAWQQIGRAGRKWDKDAFVLFYAMNDPIDHFYVGNLHAFRTKPFDELVVDPGNEGLIENHLDSLVNETSGGLRDSDRTILGDAFFEARENHKGMLPRGFRPQQKVNMRGGFENPYDLRYGNEVLGKISGMRRFREAYIGAIFTFFGQKYRVHSHLADAIELERAEPNLKTEPKFYTVLYQTDIFDGFGYDDIELIYGALGLIMNFTGYNEVNEHTGEVIAQVSSDAAYTRKNLHGVWFNFPTSESTSAGIGALEHMLRVGAMFVIPADPFDTNTYSRSSEESAAFYYENYPAGIGIAKKLFEVWRRALSKGIAIAQDCECGSGCTNCIEPAKSYDISNTEIDKVRGVELAEILFAAVDKGEDRRYLT